MKKYISLILAVVVALACFAPVSFAAESPTLLATPEKITTFTGSYAEYAEFADMGFDVYEVTFAATGVAMETTLGTGMTKPTNGNSIIGVSIKFDTTTTAVYGEEWMLAESYSLTPATSNAATFDATAAYAAAYIGTDPLYPAKKVAKAVAKDDVSDPLYKVIFVITPDKPVTLSFKECDLSIGKFNSNNIVAADGQYYAMGSGLTMSPATLTLPPADESKPVTGITLNPTVLNFTVGDAAQTISATVTPNDADDPSIDWTTSNASVATVAGGVVTPVGVGTATITATAHDGSGITATCAVTVSPKLVSSITLDKSEIQLQVGEGTDTITATVAPPTATDTTVNWTTSNASVATVAGGVVTPVGAGTATITATANDGSGANASCTVTVKAANPAPVLSQNFTKIDLGDQIENLVGEKFDADSNYGAGRITASIDTVKYDYKVFASDYDNELITKSWDYAISEAEIAEGTINFIAIVKSATHKIGNIWLQAVVK